MLGRVRDQFCAFLSLGGESRFKEVNNGRNFD
jgi:hypothetical protein